MYLTAVHAKDLQSEMALLGGIHGFGLFFKLMTKAQAGPGFVADHKLT